MMSAQLLEQDPKLAEVVRRLVKAYAHRCGRSGVDPLTLPEEGTCGRLFAGHRAA